MGAVLEHSALAPRSQRIAEREALRTLEDGEVVQRHVAGDSQAFDVIVDRYQTRLLNFINRVIRDRERAEDLVQETFVRILRHAHRFDPTKKFSTWIYTIASNLAKNELRNRRRSPLVLFQTLAIHWEADHRPIQFEDAGARPDALYDLRVLEEALERCVGELPEHHRAVLVLRELEGKSYEEIAEITGSNLGTVKSRLNRARSRLAEAMAPMLA